jgi:hypothetical protein
MSIIAYPNDSNGLDENRLDEIQTENMMTLGLEEEL